jgi:hypothetical protein
MKTKLSIRLHLAVWCVALLLTIIPLFSGDHGAPFIGHLIAALFWIAVYYLFYRYLSRLLLDKKLVLYFAVSALTLLILPFAGYFLLFISRALNSGNFSDFFRGYGPSMHFSGSKALLQAGLFGSLFRMITEYYGE